MKQQMNRRSLILAHHSWISQEKAEVVQGMTSRKVREVAAEDGEGLTADGKEIT